MITTILISIYVLSGVAWYLSVRYEHTHRFKGIDPFAIDIIIVFIPLLNTLWSILAWGSILLRKLELKRIYEPQNITAKFFRIK